jgi:hypothetical protein
MTRLVQIQNWWRRASLPAVEPGVPPGGKNRAQSGRLSKFPATLINPASNSGGKMPPSTAGADVCRYKA